jgi:hypothetical protein
MKWKQPVIIDQSAQHASIAVDGNGRIYIVYPGMGDRSLYYVASDDYGATWNFPQMVMTKSSSKVGSDYTRLSIGENGTLHLVWTDFQLPQGWPPIGVYYSSSGDEGHTWSDPVKLAGEGFDQVSVIVGESDVVHVAWNGMAGVGGRYHRWSEDDGRTWSTTNTISTLGATEGLPQLALDSTGTLHLATSSDQRVWYYRWEDQKWSDPVYIPSGDEHSVPPLGQRLTERDVRHIEQPAMTIGLGNQIHVVFWVEPADEGRAYLWYTTKVIDAPLEDPTPFAALSATVTATPYTSALENTIRRSKAVPIPDLSQDLPEVSSTVSFRETVLISVPPVVLILVGISVYWAANKYRER